MSEFDESPGQFSPLPHTFFDALIKAGIFAGVSFAISLVAYPNNMNVKVLDMMIPMHYASAAAGALASFGADLGHVMLKGPWEAHQRMFNLGAIAFGGALLPAMIFLTNPSLISVSGSAETLSAVKLLAIGAAGEFAGNVGNNTMKQWGVL